MPCRFPIHLQAIRILPTGTEIRNFASISFDRQSVITTNQIDPENPLAGVSTLKEALNTIDSDIPSSSVEVLAKKVFTTTFVVKWSGTDSDLGTGVSTYDVLVSIDGGPFTEWLDRTTSTTSVYTGSVGHTYAFISVAFDNAGNQEAIPITADAITRVSRPPRLNPRNPLDVDDDGDVSPLDVLIIVNTVNEFGFRQLIDDPEEAPYYDTDGDNDLSALDILRIVNFINIRANGEGEKAVANADRFFETLGGSLYDDIAMLSNTIDESDDHRRSSKIGSKAIVPGYDRTRIK